MTPRPPPAAVNLSVIPIPRNRAWYALAMALVIGAGLLLRSGWLPLPDYLVKYGGDALWALVVFLGLGLLFPRHSTSSIAWGAFALSWAVEFLQLYHAPWIDAIRATLPGRLLLGSTFHVPDLAAYVIGVEVGGIAELCRRRIPLPPSIRPAPAGVTPP